VLKMAFIIGVSGFDLLLELVDLVFSVEHVGSNVNLFVTAPPPFSQYYH
jgi:hypothetical protein